MIKFFFVFSELLLIFTGVLGIISSFGHRGEMGYLFSGVGCLVFALFLHGMSILVEAAQIYIEKQKEAEE